MSAGAALIPTIVAKRQIKRAADSGILASPTFKQLVSGCLLHGVLGLVVLSQGGDARERAVCRNETHRAVLSAVNRTAKSSGTRPTTTFLALRYSWAVSLRSPLLAGTREVVGEIRESGQLVPSASGLLGGVLSLLTPANLTAAAYSAATIALMGWEVSAPGSVAGVLLFTADPFSPSLLFILPKDPIHVFFCRVLGAATLANAVFMFTVKQAADDGRQGSPVFRNINGGVAASSAITAGVLGYGLATGWARSEPPFWALIGVMATTGLVSGYNWATAPK
ncbi:hypothetical protein VOLCADRAFT_89982 [Volvox carteri f. nagariensis]|uniref:Uncharacterized protein n=1 Tax=Volvox carteri f. nagariensis TaxID=3068 RepID=D8TT63_VOLCA|nr:uncharacterized protein VOLCADRAFT_89982 [Volvox carteri f. nagariensis]EFJ49140.1 hypothetical protein VOLCADRAFT_89982 [Volvox carteri f. nagariensis]|eukprot:XP_002949588.1 hypothetical protein VOLCADRAFT_89982 [Volvox carteri f. nagariensis]